MLGSLGRFLVNRRVAVLVATGLLVVVAGMLGRGVAERLETGGFDDQGSESFRAARLLERRLDAGEPNLVLLVTARHGTVDDPAAAGAGRALTAELAAEPDVRQVRSYWSLDRAPPLRGEGGRRALVLGFIPGADSRVDDVIAHLSPAYTRSGRAIDVAVGGRAEVSRQVDAQIHDDLLRAELIAFPVTLVLLVLVFGSVVAAALPLAVGGIAIVGSLLTLSLIASLTEVSVYALNLTTALGLGLAIDYSLFIVSRYREEMRAGRSPPDAVVRTVRTAGATVLGSALTVAVSLAALLVFRPAFLRSFAYAGIAVSLLAAAAAVVFLPALLAVLGHRVDALRIIRREPKPVGEGVWHRVASAVMRRPVPIAAAVVTLLVVLGLPFFRLELGIPDDRGLPSHLSSRVVHDRIREEFSSREAGAVQVVAPEGGRASRAAIDGYARALSRLDGVARVDARTGIYVGGASVPAPAALTKRFASDGAATWLSVVPNVEPLSPAGERLAREVRDVGSPVGEVLVAGPSAELVDSKASLYERLPWALAWVALATFVLLFLMFGGLLVPAKALVLNVLSLSAVFGAMVWVFQDGHLAGPLDFTPTGTLPATIPILLFCVAFGLSMDYEVFLLSRIKEEHDRTGDNQSSVAIGLERTGRIVTAAAILISVVFVAFATSGVTFIKLFGLGLSLAVLMDAFVIRATLVPAFMRLAGEANWWSPPLLRRVYERFGFHEAVDGLDAPTGSGETASPDDVLG